MILAHSHPAMLGENLSGSMFLTLMQPATALMSSQRGIGERKIHKAIGAAILQEQRVRNSGKNEEESSFT